MNNVKLVRIISGEDLLATISSNLLVPGEVILEDIVQLVMTSPTNIGLVPFQPWADLPNGKLVLRKEHVLWMVDPKDNLLNEYQKVFSKIITATKPSLVIPQ